jgi:hypothetical protein
LNAWLLHGSAATVVNYQPFPAYFSGAPVIYPVIGALADSAGGLAGARMLSLCFMLITTALLYDVTRRTFDRRAAVFAVALFAGLGSVQFLGAFATYDAMALMLLAAASWIGVRSSALRSPGAHAGLLVLCALFLALANATKYASALFDPVVIGLVSAAAWRERGRARGALAAVTATAGLAAMLAGALRLAGRQYWTGIAFTTLTRGTGTAPALGVLYVSGKWVGVVALLAVAGAVAATPSEGRAGRTLAWVLASAPFLAPAEQARIHTITSLFKHVGYGSWFGCIVAGYALASLARAVPAAKARKADLVGACTAALAMAAGVALAGTHFAGWPDSAQMVKMVGPAVARGGCPCLMTENNVVFYYLPGLEYRGPVVNAYFFRYHEKTSRLSLSGVPAYEAAIRDRYFKVVQIDPSENGVVYKPVVAALESSRAYRLIGASDSGTAGEPSEVWVLEGAAR